MYCACQAPQASAPGARPPEIIEAEAARAANEGGASLSLIYFFFVSGCSVEIATNVDGNVSVSF